MSRYFSKTSGEDEFITFEKMNFIEFTAILVFTVIVLWSGGELLIHKSNQHKLL